MASSSSSDEGAQIVRDPRKARKLARMAKLDMRTADFYQIAPARVAHSSLSGENLMEANSSIDTISRQTNSRD